MTANALTLSSSKTEVLAEIKQPAKKHNPLSTPSNESPTLANLKQGVTLSCHSSAALSNVRCTV